MRQAIERGAFAAFREQLRRDWDVEAGPSGDQPPA